MLIFLDVPRNRFDISVMDTQLTKKGEDNAENYTISPESIGSASSILEII